MDELDFEKLFLKADQYAKKRNNEKRLKWVLWACGIIVLTAALVIAVPRAAQMLQQPEPSQPQLSDTTPETTAPTETQTPPVGITVTLGSWKEDGSLGYGLPMQFVLNDPELSGDVRFQITMDSGNLIGDITLDKYKENPWEETGTMESANIGHSDQIDNGETVFWQGHIGVEAEKDTVYGKVFVFEERIVGIALIGITLDPETECYHAETLFCEYFLPIDGEYQGVSNIYIEQQFAAITGEEIPVIWRPNGYTISTLVMQPYLGNPAFEGMPITFQVRVNEGYFEGDDTLDKYQQRPEGAMLGSEFSIDNGEIIIWNGNVSDEPIYVEMLIQCADQYIGYAVAEICESDVYTTEFRNLGCEYWPFDNEYFSDVTREFLEEEIQKLETNNEE